MPICPPPEWVKTARSGDKVVCINDDWSGGVGAVSGQINWATVARRGKMYEVSSIYADYRFICGIVITVVGCTAGYDATLFRPAQKGSNETGMSILRKLLDRRTTEQTEDA